jgi:hypothetical protein
VRTSPESHGHGVRPRGELGIEIVGNRLALTSQCGFQAAADRDGAHLDFDTQWRKLELIVETARQVWRS